jgi:hypothetical protein
MKFVDNVLTVLAQCFDLAVVERPALLEVNPAEIRLPKHDRREMFLLDDAAAYAAFRGAMNAHFHALLDFLVRRTRFSRTHRSSRVRGMFSIRATSAGFTRGVRRAPLRSWQDRSGPGVACAMPT